MVKIHNQMRLLCIQQSLLNLAVIVMNVLCAEYGLEDE